MNILRDAAHLQTQLRLYDGLVDTRFLLLKLRPNLRQNWIGLALAYHLNGNLADARKVLEQYERSLKVRVAIVAVLCVLICLSAILQNVPDYDPEQSDLLLYHVKILEDMDELAEALTLLDVNAKSRAIVDRVAVMEIRGVFLSYQRCALIDGLRMTARLLSRRGPGTEAEQAWRALIHCNPDNTSYYHGFFNSKGIDLGNIRPAFWRTCSSTDYFIVHRSCYRRRPF